jgi:HPt (histidine-containing phosphotransfer) domain-containing protein
LFNTLVKWIKPKNRTTQQSQIKVEEAKVALSNLSASPQNIEGLDFALGMKTVMNKEALYTKMIKKYLVDQPKTIAELRQAIASNDLASAERLAHTSKGVNGNIGAKKLQSLSAEIEKSIHQKANSEKILSELDLLEKAQSKMIADLSKFYPLEGSDQGSTNTEKPRAKLDEGIISELVALINDSDTQATLLIEKHMDALQSHFGNQKFQEINNALLGFDFEKAAQLISG